MKKSARKKIFNAVFVVAVFGITLWYVFHGENLGQVIDYLKTADPMHIAFAVVCVLGFVIGESVIIHYLMRNLGTRIKFSHCCLYSFIGFFYSFITPSASGGQPMQVIAMRKDKVPVAVSTVVLAIVAINFKLVLVIIGAVVLITQPPVLMMYLEPVKPIIYLGMLLNVIAISTLMLMVFHPDLVRVLAEKVFGLLRRIKPLRNIEKYRGQLETIIGQYQGTAEFFRNNILVIIRVFMITLLQRFLFFLVTWIIYSAFALREHGMPVITTLQAMIAVGADMMPLPGGVGINESLFLEIFTPVFGEDLVLPGMILSRGISYYTQLFISAVMTVAATFIIKDRMEESGEDA